MKINPVQSEEGHGAEQSPLEAEKSGGKPSEKGVERRRGGAWRGGVHALQGPGVRACVCVCVCVCVKGLCLATQAAGPRFPLKIPTVAIGRVANTAGGIGSHVERGGDGFTCCHRVTVCECHWRWALGGWVSVVPPLAQRLLHLQQVPQACLSQDCPHLACGRG